MAPLTVLGVLRALPRIQDMSEADGLFVESLMCAFSQSSSEAATRLAEFAEKRGRPNDSVLRAPTKIPGRIDNAN